MGFLDELRVDQEVAHTRLLAWLLNPNGDHELGTDVLSAFWSMTGLGKSRRGLRSAKVHLEERQAETRADIVIITEPVYVLVENKIRWRAFNEWQIVAHAKSGNRKAARNSKTFKLVLLLPDSRYKDEHSHRCAIDRLGHQLGAEIITWDDIVAAFRKVVSKSRLPKAPGLTFLPAYCEFIEREILRKWKGFNMQIFDKSTVVALATYLRQRDQLMKELKNFAESVRVRLGQWRNEPYHEETEKQFGKKDLLVYNMHYSFRKHPKTRVEFSFWVDPQARSNKGLKLWISFWTTDKDAIDKFKRAGLHTRRAVDLQFKEVSGFGSLDEEFWVEKLVPQELWLTDDEKAAADGTERIARILRRYLTVTQKLLGDFV